MVEVLDMDGLYDKYIWNFTMGNKEQGCKVYDMITD